MNLPRSIFIVTTIVANASLFSHEALADVTYRYVGNLLSDGSGPVKASVTFDGSVTGTFSGLVTLSNIVGWHIESDRFSFTSVAPAEEPDPSGYIHMRFQFASGVITRWDFTHNPGTSGYGTGYDIYTMGNSFVVGHGVTEDGALDSLGINRAVTGNPGVWAPVPEPAQWALLLVGLGAIVTYPARSRSTRLTRPST